MGRATNDGSILSYTLTFLALSSLAGCGGSPAPNSPVDPSPPPPASCSPACTGGAACASGTCSAVSLSVPLATTDADGVHVNGPFLLEILAEGAAPALVDLTIDGVVVSATRPGMVQIATSRLASGPHLLEATARYATTTPGVTVAASPVRLPVLVDRSEPLLAWTPEPGVTSLVGVTEISFRAPEPLAPVFPAQDVEVVGFDLDSHTLPPYDVVVDAAVGLVTVRFAAPLDLVNALTVRAHVTDRAGNPSRNEIASWNQPPLRVTIDPPGPVWTNGAVAYLVNLEGGPGDVTLEFYPPTDTRAALVVPITGPPYSATVDTTWLGEAPDPWYVRAYARRGRATFVSDVRLLYVDRRRPAVSRCGPLWSAIEEAYLEEPLVGEFTEAMDPSTFPAGIGVRGGSNLPLPVSLTAAPDGRSVEIRSAPDGSGASSLTLGGTLSDLAGNALSEPAACLVLYPEWQMPGRGDVSFPRGPRGPQLVLGAPVAGQGSPPTLLASEGGWGRLHSLVDGHWSNQWMQLPTLTPAGTVEGPAMGVNTAGAMIAAWVEVAGPERRVLVARREPFSWTWIGTPVNGDPASGARQPTIAVDVLGHPTVAWIEDRAGVAVLVARRWDGSGWADLGDGSPLNGSTSWPASAPRLLLDASSHPVLAWREGIASGEEVIRVRRWAGQGWTEPLGGFLAGTARAPSAPSLALEASGQPVIAWSEPVGGVEQAFVHRWNGSSWVGLGGSISPGAGQWARSPSLSLGPGDVPYLAVIEPGMRADEIHVLRFDGAAWVDVSGPLNLDPRRGAEAPSLAVDPRGRPAVAWLEGGSILGFRRYNR